MKNIPMTINFNSSQEHMRFLVIGKHKAGLSRRGSFQRLQSVGALGWERADTPEMAKAIIRLSGVHRN